MLYLWTAGNYYLRAGMYYFTGERFIEPGDRKRRIGAQAIECQTKGILRRYPNVEKVEVPYEGRSLPALFMRAPGGAVVRAVFPGRVAFADSYADYGRTVILDHGGGYYTLSANLGEIEVKVGDDVKGGARIASLAGGSAGSMLYFEVRIGQETADPAEWFGI